MAAIKLYFGLIFLGVTAFISSIICNHPPIDPVSAETEPTFTIEQSQNIAEQFIRNSATFSFDGIDGILELKDIESLDRSDGWIFVFEFQSAHPGYGDRSGLVLPNVITHHRADITVFRGKVTRAALDGWWNMIEQKRL